MCKYGYAATQERKIYYWEIRQYAATQERKIYYWEIRHSTNNYNNLNCKYIMQVFFHIYLNKKQHILVKQKLN